MSFCIFDSQDKSFTAQCVQASGTVEEVPVSEVLSSMKVILKKKFSDKDEFLKQKVDIKDFSGAINNRIYRIVVNDVFVLDRSNPDMDTRVKVEL